MTTTTAKKPTYLLKLVRPQTGPRRYPVKVGVSFATEKGNQRLLWDVIPSESELRDGVLILIPYEEPQAEPAM